MEQGDYDPSGFLTAEIVRGKERDQYGDENRGNPISEQNKTCGFFSILSCRSPNYSFDLAR
jgi:hypothetical protein